MRSRCAVVFLLLLSSFVPAGEKAPEGTLRVLLALSFRPFPGLFGTEVSDRTALPSVGKKDLERIRRRIRRGIDLFCREVASRSALEKRTVKRILSRSSLRGVLFTEGAERKGTGIGLLLRIHFPSLPLSGVKAFLEELERRGVVSLGKRERMNAGYGVIGRGIPFRYEIGSQDLFLLPARERFASSDLLRSPLEAFSGTGPGLRLLCPGKLLLVYDGDSVSVRIPSGTGDPSEGEEFMKFAFPWEAGWALGSAAFRVGGILRLDSCFFGKPRSRVAAALRHRVCKAHLEALGAFLVRYAREHGRVIPGGGPSGLRGLQKIAESYDYRVPADIFGCPLARTPVPFRLPNGVLRITHSVTAYRERAEPVALKDMIGKAKRNGKKILLYEARSYDGAGRWILESDLMADRKG